MMYGVCSRCSYKVVRMFNLSGDYTCSVPELTDVNQIVRLESYAIEKWILRHRYLLS